MGGGLLALGVGTVWLAGPGSAERAPGPVPGFAELGVDPAAVDPSLGPLLVERLSVEDDPARRRALIGLLGRAGGRSALDALLAGVPRERADRTWALGRLGAGSEAASLLADTLVGRLGDADPEVREAAAWGLTVNAAPDLWIRWRETVAGRLEAYGATGDPAARYLLRAVGRLLPRPMLRSLLAESRDWRVRVAAVEALASHADGLVALDDLAPALDDPHPAVRWAARGARAGAGAPPPDPAGAASPRRPRSPGAAPGEPTPPVDAPPPPSGGGSRPRVRLATDAGDIVIALASDQAPATVAHFLELVAAGHYDGRTVHRVVPGAVVQVGGSGGVPGAPPHEPGLVSFRRGVVGWARSARGPDGDDFFVVQDHQPLLDGEYAPLGWVVEGMAVVDAALPGTRILRAAAEADPGDSGGGL